MADLISLSLLLVEPRSFGLSLLDVFWPVGPDEGENIPNVLVAQLIAERRHSAVERDSLSRHGRLAAELRVGKEQAVGMVPGMSSLVMGRGWEKTIGVCTLPVGLPLKINSVAGRAILGIKAFALRKRSRRLG